MEDSEKPCEDQKETQAASPDVSQPIPAIPHQPPSAPNGQHTDHDEKATLPVAVDLIEDSLSGFERESLEISKRAERIAIFALIAAIAAAVFLFTQVRVMSYQTQIMASDSEANNAGASLGERHTMDQIKALQTQAYAAQNSATTLSDQVRQTQNEWRDEHRPWLGLKDDIQVQESPFQVDNKYVYWTIKTSIWNYGLSPATRVITVIDNGDVIQFREHGTWKNTEKCKSAVQLSRSSPDYYPDASGLFPGTSLPFNDGLPVVSDSIYLAVCIAYTDATKRTYSTKLLYLKAQNGFRLLDAEIK